MSRGRRFLRLQQTIKLIAGDTITGTVGPVRDGSVSVITDYGPVRIPLEKLTDESKAKLGIGAGTDADALRKRITELEDLVARLREENAALRRSAAGTGSTSTPAPIQPLTDRSGTGSRVPPELERPAPATESGAFRVSSTGKHHNSRCRYYSSKDRASSATE